MIDIKRSLLNINYINILNRPIPRRNSFVSLVLYENGLFSYILSAHLFKIGKIMINSWIRNLVTGNSSFLVYIPYGIPIYNLEIKLGFGGQYCRAAGSFCKIISKFINKYGKLLIELKSGEQYLVNKNCQATLGVSSNINYWFKNWQKAGMSRKLGFRSSVRGVAMNPVDHPHGGRTNGGRPSISYSGVLAKGKKTRKKKICNKVIFKRIK